MEKQKAILKNDYNTVHISFYNLCNDDALCVEYRYGDSEKTYRGRNRKIYSNKKGRYVLHHKQKAYLID